MDKSNVNGQHAYSAEEIADWLNRYRASGLGLERFAREHGLAPGRLHYWLYQKRRPRPAKPRRKAPLFQEVKLAEGSPLLSQWAAEFSLPGGTTVRLSATAPSWIGPLIRTLYRPC